MTTYMRPLTLAIASLIFNTALGFWVYYYIYAATNPNPRIAVNSTHARWTAYETALAFYGLALSTYNTVTSFFFLRWALRCAGPPSPKGGATDSQSEVHKIRVLCIPWALMRQPQRARYWVTLVALLPIAVAISTAPFVIPFASLPIAQEWAWNHRCDTWDVEVVLQGRHPSEATSSATFSFDDGRGYTYDLYNGRSLLYRYPDIANTTLPTLQNVTFDLTMSQISGQCLLSAHHFDCLSGQMDQDLDSTTHLTFNFTADLGFGNQTSALRAVDRDWQYSDDAPSLILHDLNVGRNVMRTAVTKRGDCTQLKICANDFGEANLLVPVGRILIAQEKWSVGTTCGPKG